MNHQGVVALRPLLTVLVVDARKEDLAWLEVKEGEILASRVALAVSP